MLPIALPPALTTIDARRALAGNVARSAPARVRAVSSVRIADRPGFSVTR